MAKPCWLGLQTEVEWERAKIAGAVVLFLARPVLVFRHIWKVPGRVTWGEEP